jgi:hypothetical protein
LPKVREAVRTHHAQDHVRERKNAARRVRWAAEPDRRRRQLAYTLKRVYGVTIDWYEAALAEQQGRCAICGTEPDASGVRAAARLHVDHDHVTGTARSLLCNRCNQGIGYFKDDPALFRAAAEYIERHRAAT